MNLEDYYRRVRKTESGIYKHVPKLRELASKSRVVTEFGVRGGVSTTALLAGQPKRLVCYDFNPCPILGRLTSLSGKTDFVFRRKDVLTVEPIDFTDFLFLDTRHTEDQLHEELKRHGHRVTRWLGFHDTTTFGKVGEDGERGVMHAIRRWMKDNPEWFVHYHSQINNGFLVLSRSSRDVRVEML